jgi:hypothetical protein
VTDDVERLLAGRPSEIAALARRTLALARSVFPDAVTTVDDDNIGLGRGTGYKGLVFVIAPHRAHVNLGVSGGASLPDPARLLEGTGKVHRHVKIREAAELDRPELRALMQAAAERAG